MIAPPPPIWWAYSGWLRSPFRTTIMKQWMKPLFVGMYKEIYIIPLPFCKGHGGSITNMHINMYICKYTCTILEADSFNSWASLLRWACNISSGFGLLVFPGPLVDCGNLRGFKAGILLPVWESQKVTNKSLGSLLKSPHENKVY